MLEFVDDDVARITDFGSLDGYVDLVPLGRIETFCPFLEVESYLVGFFLCCAISFRLDIEGDAWLRIAVWKSVMINSSVSLADFRGVDVVFALYIERRYFLFVTYLIISRYRKTQT